MGNQVELWAFFEGTKMFLFWETHGARPAPVVLFLWIPLRQPHPGKYRPLNSAIRCVFLRRENAGFTLNSCVFCMISCVPGENEG